MIKRNDGAISKLCVSKLWCLDKLSLMLTCNDVFVVYCNRLIGINN